jgi:hypothetical protein
VGSRVGIEHRARAGAPRLAPIARPRILLGRPLFRQRRCKSKGATGDGRNRRAPGFVATPDAASYPSING